MLELPPDRLVELERCRAELRNGWRIADDCGLPRSETEKVREMIFLEMKFYCGDWAISLSVSHHAALWLENRNPFHIDAAVIQCADRGATIPPALAMLVGEVARARFDGSTRAGTPTKIRREAAKNYAFTLMARLRGMGYTLQEASRKAAAQLQHPGFLSGYKASTLEKLYAQAKPPMEQHFRDAFARDAALADQWAEIAAQLPDAPPELWGEPR